MKVTGKCSVASVVEVLLKLVLIRRKCVVRTTSMDIGLLCG